MEHATVGFPILTMLVMVPAVGALLTALVGNRRPDLVKLVALLSSVVTAGMSIWLLAAFRAHSGDFQFVSKHSWISAWGISWHLGVDGISLFLVVLTLFLFPIALLATGLSFMASSAPDGLEWVYFEQGIGDAGAVARAPKLLGDGGPLADYQVAGLDNEALSRAIAGLIGLTIVGALLTAVAIRRRRQALAG